MAKGKGKGGKSGEEHSPTIENRKARHDYEILDTLETGMVLMGSEVKSIRDGKVSLAEGYVRAEDGTRRLKAGGGKPAAVRLVEPGLFLHSVNIGEYLPAGPVGGSGQHFPTRTRKLLAHKKEIERLAREVQVKGLTLIPLKVYFKNGKAKLLVGLARGRKQSDKREAIAKRETDRDMARAMTRRA